jgi:rhamnosyltransferase
MVLELQQQFKFTLILNKQNLGVAKALNIGIKEISAKDFSWGLIFDQDSIVCGNLMDVFHRTYLEIPDKNRICALGTSYIDPNTKRVNSFPHSVAEKNWIEVKALITSGTLLSISSYEEIGPFREEFFIDSVDTEYSLRARCKGFHMYLLKKQLMFHPIGTAKIHLFLGLPFLKIYSQNHFPWRHYFMLRNSLILSLEYLFYDPCWSLNSLMRSAIQLVVTCCYEERRIQKIHYSSLGFCDALTRNFDRKGIIPNDRSHKKH